MIVPTNPHLWPDSWAIRFSSNSARRSGNFFPTFSRRGPAQKNNNWHCHWHFKHIFQKFLWRTGKIGPSPKEKNVLSHSQSYIEKWDVVITTHKTNLLTILRSSRPSHVFSHVFKLIPHYADLHFVLQNKIHSAVIQVASIVMWLTRSVRAEFDWQIIKRWAVCCAKQNASQCKSALKTTHWGSESVNLARSKVSDSALHRCLPMP